MKDTGDTQVQVFPCEFSKIFQNHFFQNTSGWLLLEHSKIVEEEVGPVFWPFLDNKTMSQGKITKI